MASGMQLDDLVLTRSWTSDGDQASVQRLWWKVGPTTGTGATDQQMADQLEAILAPLYKVAINNGAKWCGVQAQIYRNGSPFADVSSIAHAGAGTGGTLPLPRQSSGIISWGTTLAGRRFRGRMYMPFPATIQDEGIGVPTDAYVAEIQAVADNLLGFNFVGTGGGSAQVNLILRHGPGKTPTPTDTFMADGTAQKKWATQRRRGSYGKINTSPI